MDTETNCWLDKKNLSIPDFQIFFNDPSLITPNQ